MNSTTTRMSPRDGRGVVSGGSFLGVVFLLAVCLLCPVSIAGKDVRSVQPIDNGEVLINPDMGWTLHFYSNYTRNYGSKLTPSDTLSDFPGLSTIYLRVPWAYLEPEEGEYNWELFDTPAQRWIAEGKKIAFRVTCSENWMMYATPEWVREAGAEGYFYKFSRGRVESEAEADAWDPKYDDPVYLEKLDTFLAAFAERYDGNPNVAFVDVGTYGLWGEGHTFMTSDQDTLDIQKLHIDLHLKHFDSTLLCISDDFAGHDKPGRRFPITDYAHEHGVTLRDDSILTQRDPTIQAWYHAEMAELFWPDFPVILEHQHYGTCERLGTWMPDLVVESVEAYHASYMSIHWFPREYLEKNRAMIDRINERMGYRIVPTEVTWPREVTIAMPDAKFASEEDLTDNGDTSRSFRVAWSWKNTGVAPCYPGGFPALTLKDRKGGIVAVLVDESFDVRTLGVGPRGGAPITSHESEFLIGLYGPTTRAGTYDVYLSIGARDGTPTIALPLDHDDGQRRYRLGTIDLLPLNESAP